MMNHSTVSLFPQPLFPIRPKNPIIYHLSFFRLHEHTLVVTATTAAENQKEYKDEKQDFAVLAKDTAASIHV